MDESLAVALKFGFLLVLYLFLLWVARSALRDLSRGVETVSGSATAAQPPDPAGRRRDARRDGAAARSDRGARLRARDDLRPARRRDDGTLRPRRDPRRRPV